MRESGGPFESIADLIQRVDSRKVNKKALKVFVKAGAFDSIGISRGTAMKAVNDILSKNGKGSRHSGQAEHFWR